MDRDSRKEGQPEMIVKCTRCSLPFSVPDSTAPATYKCEYCVRAEPIPQSTEELLERARRVADEHLADFNRIATSALPNSSSDLPARARFQVAAWRPSFGEVLDRCTLAWQAVQKGLGNAPDEVKACAFQVLLEAPIEPPTSGFFAEPLQGPPRASSKPVIPAPDPGSGGEKGGPGAPEEKTA
jgi:hypothetical protein